MITEEYAVDVERLNKMAHPAEVCVEGYKKGRFDGLKFGLLIGIFIGTLTELLLWSLL